MISKCEDVTNGSTKVCSFWLSFSLHSCVFQSKLKAPCMKLSTVYCIYLQYLLKPEWQKPIMRIAFQFGLLTPLIHHFDLLHTALCYVQCPIWSCADLLPSVTSVISWLNSNKNFCFLCRCVSTTEDHGGETVPNTLCNKAEIPNEIRKCSLYCPNECAVSDWGPWSTCPQVGLPGWGSSGKFLMLYSLSFNNCVK